jgi:hypothetical protein
MKRLVPLAYSAVFFLVLLLGWYFGSRTSTVHADSTNVTYFGTSANGCTAEPNSTCNVTLNWPDGGFADDFYQVNCAYYTFNPAVPNQFPGPFYQMDRNGVVPQSIGQITFALTPATLNVTFNNATGVATQMLDLVCFATHN